MSKPFDATMRQLFELGPAAWLEFLHIKVSHPDRASVIDSNLSTISAEADKAIWVAEPLPWVEHIELQASRALDLPERAHVYSTLLHRTHKVPVHSTIVLLRPEADGPELTGTCNLRHRNGDVYAWFRYDVVRIWRRPVEEILTAGLPVLPLAPISDLAVDRLSAVLTAVARRLKAEAPPQYTRLLWAATRVLMGLRFPKDQIELVTERISSMILGIEGIEESSVYQDIFAKGETKGRTEGRTEGCAEGELKSARTILLRAGTKRFGPPDEETSAKLTNLSDLGRLFDLVDRVQEASSWEDLLSAQRPST